MQAPCGNQEQPLADGHDIDKRDGAHSMSRRTEEACLLASTTVDLFRLAGMQMSNVPFLLHSKACRLTSGTDSDPRLVAQGFESPAQLLASLDAMCDDALLAGLDKESEDYYEDSEEEDDEEEDGEDDEDDKDDDSLAAEEGRARADQAEEEPCGRCETCKKEAAKRELADACQALESKQKELAGAEELTRELRRRNERLSVDANRTRGGLELLEQKLQETNAVQPGAPVAPPAPAKRKKGSPRAPRAERAQRGRRRQQCCKFS
eukprot:g38858.t1